MNTTNTAASTLLKTLATKETPLLTHFFVNTTAGLEPHFNQEPFTQSGVSSTLSKTAVSLALLGFQALDVHAEILLS